MTSTSICARVRRTRSRADGPKNTNQSRPSSQTQKRNARATKSIAVATLALIGAALPAGAGAQDAQSEDSIELIDPHVFRACADPRNLPFSNEAGEGFENKIAELFARKLGKSVGYTFYPGATGFIRNTLNAHRCDVVLGIAQGDDIVQPTSPYYRTSYVAAYRADGPLKGLDSLGDPRLKTARIGIVAGTPPASVLADDGLLGQIKSYALVVDTRFDSPTHEMMDDLDHGDIDVALLWGPIAGYYASKAKNPTTIVPLVKEQNGPRMVYRIVMGVRHSDQNWKRTLNKLISENKTEIQAILQSYGVPLLDENDQPISR
jgi:quinoprotein dehydrogenase-associated probable ABC transporter substrate-binding protein